MYIYKNSEGVYFVNNRTVGAGEYSMINHGNDIISLIPKSKFSSLSVYSRLEASSLTKEDGSKYSNYVDFIESLSDFFVKASDEGAITVEQNHYFYDTDERDAYFVTNPDELKDGIYVYVKLESSLYERVSSAWNNINPVIKGADGASGNPTWGLISGDLEDQTDLSTKIASISRISTDGLFLLKGDGTNIGDIKAEVVSGKLTYQELTVSGWTVATVDDINLASHGSLNARLESMENAREFKGSIDATGSLDQVADAANGSFWIINVAGTLAGVGMGVNDMVICHTDTVGVPTDLSNFSHIPSSVSIMVGATSTSDGVVGLVPQAVMGEEDYVLRGSGNWRALDVNAEVGDFKSNIRSADYDGWILCDGRSLTALQIASLTNEGIYDVWSAAYGDFLPDPRGRVLGVAGAGSSLASRSIGDTDGSETHTLSESELPSHNHPTPLFRSDGGYIAAGGDGRAFCNNSLTTALQGGVTDRPADQDMSTATGLGLAGGDQAHNNMQPTIFLGNLFVFLGT